MNNSDDKPKKPTKQDVEQRAILTTQVAKEGKDLRTKQQALEQINKKIEAWLRHNDPDNKGRKLWGLRFWFTTAKKRVSWKDAFLKRCGVEAANEETANAGTHEKLAAERVG